MSYLTLLGFGNVPSLQAMLSFGALRRNVEDHTIFLKVESGVFP